MYIQLGKLLALEWCIPMIMRYGGYDCYLNYWVGNSEVVIARNNVSRCVLSVDIAFGNMWYGVSSYNYVAAMITWVGVAR